jgi:hypothetical protein
MQRTINIMYTRTHLTSGNGWAAAGMLRVMETMKHSAYADELVAQTSNMTSWINEIMTGVWTYQVRLHVLNIQLGNGTIDYVSSKKAGHFSTSWTILPLLRIHHRQHC